MTGDNINAGSPLPQSHLINQQFAAFEDKLTHLLASYRFYDQAIQAMTHPDLNDESNARDWHLGLFLNQQWLTEQGEQLMTDLLLMRQTIKR